MATPANYATLIAEIDAIVDDFTLSIFQVFGGKPSNLVSLMQLIDLRYKLFEAGGGTGTIVLAVFKAVGAGTGYSIDDIIILRQTPPAAAEWYNATTGSVIATPDPADLGSVSSASNVSVLSSALPTGASTSALQSATQAAAGSNSSVATGVQGVDGGKALSVTATNTAFTVNAGTNLNTSALALESGGNLADLVLALGEIQASPTSNTVLARLKAIADALTFGVKTSANSLSVAPASDAIFTQKSSAFRSSASLSRGNNTTTYGVNDVIFGAFELANVGNSGGIIALTDIRFLMNITYLPSGIGNLRLFLYDVTPPSAVADNNAFSVPSGDRASILTPSGISLGTPALATGGGSLVLSLAKVNQFVKLSGTSLFGYLVTEGAWVPTANSETATLTIMAVEA